jgi:hypothetical protein
MTEAELDAVFDRYANKVLFNKIGGRWKPNFVVS